MSSSGRVVYVVHVVHVDLNIFGRGCIGDGLVLGLRRRVGEVHVIVICGDGETDSKGTPRRHEYLGRDLRVPWEQSSEWQE
jgi:hypothetical protein